MVPLGGLTFGRGAAALAIPALFLALGTVPSLSAEIRVFTSAASLEVQQVVADEFARATGHRVTLLPATVREIQSRLTGPDKPDIVVLPAPAMDALEKAGTFRPGSRIDLARVGIGVAVRAGGQLPDISTADALRQTLLAARSIAHPDPLGGGFAGVQIVRVFERLGIADAVKPKVTLAFAFTGGVERVANGEAEIGLFNISEILPVKGAALAGPLPPDLQSYIVFSAAVHAGSVAPEVAAAYLRALASAKSRAIWRAEGFESLGNRE
jgi:molybdate transport system substrate-binding protein